MPVPPSDSPTRTLAPPEPIHSATATLVPRESPPSDHTATHGPPGSVHFTKPFEGPGSPTEFPSPDDRYVLMSFIARGGMGEVWIAKDRVLNREVALKLLRDDLKSKSFSASRFIEEARITGKLSHPGIPPIHDLGTLRDGRPFIAMKLIKGGRTLSDRLANEPLDFAELLRIFEDVCHAVSFAHDRRVIHRDLKPGNIMVGSFNEVQVMDWGLAKVLGESVPAPDSHPPADHPTASPVSVIESDRDPSSHTKAGSLLGTPAYMPPEQAKGEVARTDTRSDVFALGALLCEMLTGKPPYWAATAAEIQALAIIGQLAPALERLDSSGADPELIALAKHCLRANPDDRPFDAKQVANSVKVFRDSVEERLRQAERDRAAAEAKAAEEINTRREADGRRRVQLWLAATAVLLILGTGLGLWWTDRQAAERTRVEREKQAEVDRLEAQQSIDAQRQQLERDQRAVRNGQAIESLLVEVDAALKADDAEKAAIPFGLIEKRISEGNADALKERVERARADLTMLRDLDRTDDMMWTAEEYKLRSRRTIAAWAAALRRYGIDVASTSEAAKRIDDSILRERLLLALDLWWLHSTWMRNGSWSEQGLDAPDPKAVLALLKAADPDPFRNELRVAILRGDKSWWEALLDDARIYRQPARFAAVMGQVSSLRPAGREQILRPALERNPNDFSLILTIISVYESEKQYRLETATQQLRWSQAAVSVRPRSKVAWRSLGRAYWDKGQIDDASRSYRRAVRLDESDFNSWTQLAAVLLRKHDPEAAKEAAERAIALNPDYAYAHSNLGSVFERLGRNQESVREYNLAIEIDARNKTDSAVNFNGRGIVRMRLGDLNGAIDDFQQALRLSADMRLAETNLSAARELRKNGREVETAPPPREVKP